MDKLVEIVRHFEGFYAEAYLDPVEIWTIGYGTIIYKDGTKVKSGDVITESEAMEEMLFEMEKNKKQLYEATTTPLNEDQEQALISFIYNCGIGNFRSSTLLKRINSNNFEDVPNQLMRWINAGGRPLKGLWRRRYSEALLFIGDPKYIISKVPENWKTMKYFDYNLKNELL